MMPLRVDYTKNGQVIHVIKVTDNSGNSVEITQAVRSRVIAALTMAETPANIQQAMPDTAIRSLSVPGSQGQAALHGSLPAAVQQAMQALGAFGGQVEAMANGGGGGVGVGGAPHVHVQHRNFNWIIQGLNPRRNVGHHGAPGVTGASSSAGASSSVITGNSAQQDAAADFSSRASTSGASGGNTPPQVNDDGSS